MFLFEAVNPFDLSGLDTLSVSDPQLLAQVVGIRAARIGLIAVLAIAVFWLLRRAGHSAISGGDRKVPSETDIDARDRTQRKRTLITVFVTTARVVVFITAVLLCLPQLGVDYGPILFAAGGISLAVGFGAQSLIKDFLSGFFILLENQYVIGDRVEINGREGTVEDINLRTTIVREFNGDLFIIPNGEIRVVRNQTRNWSRVVMDIPVGYEADVDSVAELLQKAAAGMRQDENWRDKITEDAIFAGVQELAESAVIVRMLLKTLPGEQWGVAREYRRRAKVLLQEAGIEIPFPQRVLRHRYESSEERDEQKVKASTLEHKEHQVQDVSPEQGDRAEAIKQAAIKDEAANSSSRN